MKLVELLNGINYEILRGDIENTNVNEIQYDSRKVKDNDIFICIKGFAVDGHNYIESAIEKGAKTIICEKDIKIQQEGITVIKVKEGRKTLALMASNFYGNPADKLKLIGVTGTNGKTTTVYILKTILEKANKKVGLIGTVANYIGSRVIEAERTTPESLELQKLFKEMLDEGCEYCVMEVSSHSLELDRVYGCEFEVGIFTNLTRDHLDFHKTFENYYDAKFKLMERSKVLVINKDDEYGAKVYEDAKKLKDKEIVTYSIERESDLKAYDVEVKNGHNYFSVNEEKYSSVLLGKYNVYNSLGVIGAVRAIGIDEGSIMNGIEIATVPGRCERVGYKYNLPYEIIIDYAHTPDGLRNVLETVKAFTENKLISVFGCGGDRDKVKRPQMGSIGAELSDLAIITSDNPRTENPREIINDVLVGVKSKNYVAIEDRTEAIRYAIEKAVKGDVIVLAGKGHETYQITNQGYRHYDEREIIDEILSNR